jgi:type 1 glutamine amidotransferase
VNTLNVRRLHLIPALILLFVATAVVPQTSLAETQKLVLVAGKPSHPPRMHEFNAGVQLLADSLKDVKDLDVEVVLNGWPQDEAIFDNADAVVFYMDGGGRHEIVQEEGRRLKMIDEWAKNGVGLGFMHYGVEVLTDQAGDEMKRWIGGHYEHQFSCNPIWEPTFAVFPDHPVTNGVQPFQANDEWYFNMRFLSGMPGNEAKEIDGLQFQPILLAKPSDDVRDGPYVYPRGPYAHIQASGGRAEAMMWVVERPDGGRGFGFTGGHFHDNWGIEDYRKVVLNTLVWTAKGNIPEDGIQSTVSKEQLDQNLDPKKPRKKK